MTNDDRQPDSSSADPHEGQQMRAGVLSEAFFEEDANEREKLGLPREETELMSVVIELNLLHEGGLAEALAKAKRLYADLMANKPARGKDPILIADTYLRCELSINEAKELARSDQEGSAPKQRAIYRIWPDFRVRMLIDRSVATVKADAARRSYDASGAEVVWAVIDSGIDANHPHFKPLKNLGGTVEKLHRDFTKDEPTPEGALVDDFGHGTHVAGIIAGSLLGPGDQKASMPVRVGQRVAVSDDSTLEDVVPRNLDYLGRLAGVAPRCKLIKIGRAHV